MKFFPYLAIGTPKSISNLRALRQYNSQYRNSIPILVIDDNGFPYEENLRNNDFNIKVVEDIYDINSVSTYAVILSDIKGVGKKLSRQNEGGHIIREIRQRFPFKYIIAYSAQLFKTSYNKFFRLADETVQKDMEQEEWVEKLDNALEVTIDPVEQWHRYRQLLLDSKVDAYTVLKIEQGYIQSFSQKNSNKFLDSVESESLPSEIKRVSMELARSKVFSLLIGQ